MLDGYDGSTVRKRASRLALIRRSVQCAKISAASSLSSILSTLKGRSCLSLSLFRPIFLVSLRSHSSKNFCGLSDKRMSGEGIFAVPV